MPLAGTTTLLALLLAGTPFLLPPGEPADPWQSPLALAGFSLGSGRPGVEVITQGDRWVVIAWDEDGVARAAAVTRPTTPRGREDLAWLAASLVRAGVAPKPATVSAAPPPVPLPVPPPAPPPRAPSKPHVAEAMPAPPPAAPAPVVVPAPPVVIPPTAVVIPHPAMEAELPPPSHPRLEGGALGFAVLRGEEAGTGGGAVTLLAAQDTIWFQIDGFAQASSTLLPLDPADPFAVWGAATTVGWMPEAAVVAPTLGVGGTLQHLRFVEEGYAAQEAWEPAIHVAAGLDVHLPARLELLAGARAGLDLRAITFVTEGVETASIGRLWLWPTVGITFPLGE